MGFTAVFRLNQQLLEIYGLLAVSRIGIEGYVAIGFGFAKSEIKQRLRIAVTAAQLDFAVERIGIILRNHVAQYHIV